MKFAIAILTAFASASELPSPYYGYYSWNWGGGSTGTSISNSGIAFTGLTSVTKALSGYSPSATWCCPVLEKPSMLCLGGGNSAGIFSAGVLANLTADALKTVKA
jgi:hypothetical protein